MNREIEFRGYSLEEKRWIYGSLIIRGLVYGNKYSILELSDENEDKEYDVYFPTIGQYTGIKDKNNKKIFEDDWVKFSDHYFGDLWVKETIQKIEYEINGFNDDLNIGYGDYPEWCEVVGNDYENPGLRYATEKYGKL